MGSQLFSSPAARVLLFQTENFDSSYLLQGKLGKEEEGSKKEEDVGSGMLELCVCA